MHIAGTPSLAGRLARCIGLCERLALSGFDLPNFTYCGPGSPSSLYICRHCGRLGVLHDGAGHAFEPRGSSPFDSFYDGCWT
jgi:hypothetical protein